MRLIIQFEKHEKHETLLCSMLSTLGMCKPPTLLYFGCLACPKQYLPQWKVQTASYRPVLQAYEGLETVRTLREEYIFIPAKVKEVYLFHLLSSLEDVSVRSAIVFMGTCKACHLLDLLLEELGISCAALHSHKTQGRRLAALDR